MLDVSQVPDQGAGVKVGGDHSRSSRRISEKVLAQDPCERLGPSKKSPAPMLFFADGLETFEAMRNDYKDFVDAYEIAAQRLIEAAAQGYRLDPRRHFPAGCFPPSVLEAVSGHQRPAEANSGPLNASGGQFRDERRHSGAVPAPEARQLAASRRRQSRQGAVNH